MTNRFPLQDMRKAVNGVWEQVFVSETITVTGSASNYIVRLKEVPDNGVVNVKPVISGLTRTDTYPPTSGCFWINYSTGDIVFSSELVGNTYTVDYWQRGSLVTAIDLNFLYTNGVGNLDNGFPNSTFGGIDAIDCGGVT